MGDSVHDCVNHVQCDVQAGCVSLSHPLFCPRTCTTNLSVPCLVSLGAGPTGSVDATTKPAPGLRAGNVTASRRLVDR